MACSTGIAQPSIHAVRPAALPRVRRANSRAFSSRGCSAGVSGAPNRWRRAAAAPARCRACSAFDCAAALTARYSSTLRDAAFVTELLEHPDAFAIQAEGLGIVTLIAAETCQVGQGARNSPAIPELAKRSQTLFAVGTRGGEIRFFPSDVAQVIQGPGDSGFVSGLTEHRQALVIKRGGARIFAL